MSDIKSKNINIDILSQMINNKSNDEEIIINNNEQENDEITFHSGKGKNIYIHTNTFDEKEEDEKSEDTIVAFQEEKNYNLNESSDDIYTKDTFNGKNDENQNLEIQPEVPKNVLKRSSSTLIKKIKKNKKKKKKKKHIEIMAQDKNKLKKNKTNDFQKYKNIKIKKKENNKQNNQLDLLRSKSLSKSIKGLPNQINGSVEISPSKIIYENGVSDDEKELKKILKGRRSKKIRLKPVMTQFMINLKEKNEYFSRLQKIRQQFIDKKFSHEQKAFYYVLKPGNGATLVKNALKHRINWKEAQMNVTSLYNFKWQTSTMCIDYKNLSSVESIPQMVNHFEFHNTISNKSNMFLNLFEYCESHNINIWKYVPFTVFISPKNENEKKFDILYDNINKYISEFNSMDKNLNTKFNGERYSHIFKTMDFKLYGRKKDVPKDVWMMGSKTPLQIPDLHYEGKNLWVLKASNLNRGQCIRLVDSKEKFHEIIKDWSQGINLKGVNKGTTDNNIQFNLYNDNNTNQNKADEIPMSDTYITEKIIVQKYIEKPLCYYGRKCDMRVWVLLTQGMKVFVFKEGHLKTCSEKFDLNNRKDSFVHITNYSFQKRSLNFQKFELGNEVPFYDFQKYLDIEYKDNKINVKDHIMNQVKYIVELTMNSVKDKINQNKRNFCFEIFGYDFMMDVNLNVYLIEINTNPGLEISSPWIKAIVPRMVDDALRLTIDELFPTKYQFDKNAATEICYEDYSNDLTNKNENNKVEHNQKVIRKKKYTTICDQAAGTEDKIDEEYLQENIRQREVRIQKNINNNQNLTKCKEETVKNNEDSNNDNHNINENNNNNNNIKKNENEKSNKAQENTGNKNKKDDKEFDQKNYISPYPVPGYEPCDNLWEFICELHEETPQYNYTSGVRALLELQKKKQVSMAQANNNVNKRNNNVKNNGSNNTNFVKEKTTVNKVNKEMNNNTTTKKIIKNEPIKNNKVNKINDVKNKMKDKGKMKQMNKEERKVEKKFEIKSEKKENNETEIYNEKEFVNKTFSNENELTENINTDIIQECYNKSDDINEQENKN